MTKPVEVTIAERAFDEHAPICSYGCKRKTEAKNTQYNNRLLTVRTPTPLCAEGNFLFKEILKVKGMDRLTVELARSDASPI